MKNRDYPDTDVVLMSPAAVSSRGRRNNASNCHPKGLAERLPKKSTPKRRDNSRAGRPWPAAGWLTSLRPLNHDKQFVQVEKREAGPETLSWLA
jgi:hypothetical protein